MGLKLPGGWKNRTAWRVIGPPLLAFAHLLGLVKYKKLIELICLFINNTYSKHIFSKIIVSNCAFLCALYIQNTKFNYELESFVNMLNVVSNFYLQD
jgi:hypothetical protein